MTLYNQPEGVDMQVEIDPCLAQPGPTRIFYQATKMTTNYQGLGPLLDGICR